MGLLRISKNALEPVIPHISNNAPLLLIRGCRIKYPLRIAYFGIIDIFGGLTRGNGLLVYKVTLLINTVYRGGIHI